MGNEYNFPHKGYYQPARENDSQFKTSFSSKIDIERLIRGQPAFIHQDAESGFTPKILVINDWRWYLGYHNKYQQQLMYDSLQELINRKNNPFTIYAPYYDSFTRIEASTTLTDFIELASMNLEANPFFIKDNEEISQALVNAINNSQGNHDFSLESVFVIDQYEMDALMIRSGKVEYSTCIQDLIHLENLINAEIYLDNTVEEIFSEICKQTKFYTSNAYFCFDDESKDIFFFHEHFNDDGSFDNNLLSDLSYYNHLNDFKKTEVINHLINELEISIQNELKPTRLLECFYIKHAFINERDISNKKELKKRKMASIILQQTKTMHASYPIDKLSHCEKILNVKSGVTRLDLSLNRHRHNYTDISKMTSTLKNLDYLKRINYLSINPWDEVEINHYQIYLEKLKNLISLDYKNYYDNDSPLEDTILIKKDIPSLKNLFFSGVKINAKQFHHLLSHIANIESISMECQILGDFDELIRPLPYLKKIHLNNIGEYTPNLKNIPNYMAKGLANATSNLEYLSIDSNDDANIKISMCESKQQSLFQLMNKNPLKRIQLNGFFISRKQVKKIISLNLQSIQSLDLTRTNPSVIENQELRLQPSELVSQLKFFNYREGLSYDVLYEVISSSPLLQRFDFSETDTEDLKFSLTRKILLTEAFSHCRQLTSLINYNIGKFHNEYEIQQAITDKNILSLVLNQSENSPTTESIIDASFDENETPSFYCQPVFTKKSGQAPCVSKYRIDVYNQLDINLSTCEQSEAFSIKNQSNDLLLTDFSLSEENYSKATDLPDDSESQNFYWGDKLFEAQPYWQPIPSLSGNERLLSYKTSNKVKIQIKYSKRDNLYYLKTDTNIKTGTIFQLGFALEAPIVDITPNTLKYINYLSKYFKDFKNESLSFSSEGSYTGLDYYKMMKEQKKGCCRHRAILVKGSFDQSFPNNKTALRIILNACHAFCELLALDSQGQTQCYKIDLGGAPANIEKAEPLPPIIEEIPAVPELENLQDLSDLNNYELSKLSTELTDKLEEIPIANEMKKFIDDEFGALKENTKFTIEKLKTTLFSENSAKSTLLKTLSFEESYDALLSCISQLDKTFKPYYIIYHPDQLLTQEKYISTLPGTNEGKIICERGGQLYDFIQSAKNSANKVYLFVMYDALSTKEIIKFNRLIDEHRRFADSVELSNNISVIGLYSTNRKNAYKGADFISRFSHKFAIAPRFSLPQPELDNSFYAGEKITIELFNDTFWQERLLGHWQMQGEKLYFIKSEFINRLESGYYPAFIFNNPPTTPAFFHCIKKAKQQGYFLVNQHKIFLPDNISFSFSKGYNYLPYIQNLTVSIKPELEPTSMLILNESLLDDFIGGYVIKPNIGHIQISEGCIQNHKSTAPLRIFIHDSLSESAWLKLLKKIHQCQIHVELTTPSSTYLPKELSNVIHINEVSNSQEIPLTKRQRIDKNTNQSVVVIKDSEGDIDFAQHYYIQHFNTDARECLIIDVSEVTVEQLLFQVDTQFDEQTASFIFEKKPGVLLDSHYKETTVILKGIFSQSLVNTLAKLVCQRLNILQNKVNQQLLLIPQNSNCFDFLPKNTQFIVNPSSALRVRHKQLYLSFSLRLKDAYVKKMIDREEVLDKPIVQLQTMYFEANKKTPWQGRCEVTHRDYFNDEFNFRDAQSITHHFYQNRLNEIESRLQVTIDNPSTQSCFVYLTGLTGVGKTHFIQNHWANKYPNCHYGMAHLIDFCLDTREGIKTLFIDEANLENTDYSLFEGLFNPLPHLLIGQKIYYLTQHHKVIFAGNPAFYSKDRKEFSFATRHGNYCLFSEILPEVLFQVVLQPLFLLYQFSEEVTINISNMFLKRQFFANHLANKIVISPRELTAMVLMTMQKVNFATPLNEISNIADIISHQIIKSALSTTLYDTFCQKFSKPLIPNVEKTNTLLDGFLVTPSRFVCQENIKTLLSIRAQRQDSMVLMDNDTFKYDGLNGALIEGEPGIGKSVQAQKLLKENKIPFIQIAASQPIEEKEANLINAFNDGDVALMDEYNTAHLDEKFMNAILSGIHPKTHQRPKKPGFLLIATQNPPSMSGRKVFGDAIKRRFLHCPLAAYTHTEMISIIENLGVDSELAKYLVLYYLQQKIKLSHEKTPLCFRDLLNIAKKTLEQNFTPARDYAWSLFWNLDDNGTLETIDDCFGKDEPTSTFTSGNL